MFGLVLGVVVNYDYHVLFLCFFLLFLFAHYLVPNICFVHNKVGIVAFAQKLGQTHFCNKAKENKDTQEDVQEVDSLKFDKELVVVALEHYQGQSVGKQLKGVAEDQVEIIVLFIIQKSGKSGVGEDEEVDV